MENRRERGLHLRGEPLPTRFRIIPRMRPGTRKWILILMAAGVCAGAAALAGPINAMRAEQKLILPPAPQTVRPSMLLTPLLALGRAPLVDYLWIRATKLKEEGRYFDAYQLSEMICELQPRFAAVWAFQGWNMAYNISVTMKSPEERWRWVRNGFELIRDRGIPLNPNNTQLYRELAWIFFHKVGDYMDEWHAYYKLQLAIMMEDILGPPPEDYAKEGRVRDDYYREYDYRPLADAPRVFSELMADPEAASFVRKLRRFGFDAEQDGVYLSLLRALRDGTAQVSTAEEGLRETRLVELRQLMTDPKTAAARTAVERFWRARRLRNEMKLDPARIVELETAFGVRLDFRIAEAHALYWANLGMEKGLSAPASVDIHKLNTNRIEFFCLQKMFFRGRMTMSPEALLGEPPLFGPDIRFVPVLFQAYLNDSQEYLKDEFVQTPVSINFLTGFVGFMRTAIIRYDELGMRKQAQELFDFLKEHYPDPMYAKGLDGFLAEQFRYDRKDPDLVKVTARIEALLRRGLIQYAYNEDEEAARYINRAKDVFQTYRRDLSSKRLDIPRTFTELLQRTVDEIGPMMYRGSYERVRAKLGMPPLAQQPATQPAG